jgi:hypothetical protein
MSANDVIAATARMRSRLKQLLAMLAVEFLLGMGANLIGLPSEVTGTTRVATLTVIGLHVALAIGIVVVAILVSRSRSAQARRRTTVGMASVIVTFLAGVGTLMSGSAWLSFVMATGFLVAATLYGAAYVETTRSPRAM